MIRHLLLLAALILLVISWVARDATQAVAMAEFDLVGSHWWVEDIAGGGVIDNTHTTISFIESGRVAGDTGCNRYTGSYTREGDVLRFGPLAGTRRGCPPALMDQEQRFYQAMGQVVRWQVAGNGLLHLLDAQGDTVIRAAPTASPE